MRVTTTKWRENVREIAYKVTFGSLTGTVNASGLYTRSFSAAGIYASYDNGILSGEIIREGTGELTFGNACAGSLELEMYTNGNIMSQYKNRYAKIEAGIKENGTYVYETLGYFKVKDVEKSRTGETVKIYAYDDIYYMDTEWSTSLTGTVTVEDLIKEICARYHIEYGERNSGSYTYNKLQISVDDMRAICTGYTDRQVLGFIAAAMCSNVCVDRDGVLTFYKYGATTDTTISNSEIQNEGLDLLSESDVTPHSVTAGTDETQYTSGSGTGVIFTSPLLTAESLKTGTVTNKTTIISRYDEITGRAYRPLTLRWWGDPGIELGDRVSIGSEGYTAYVVGERIDLSGGYSSEIQCPECGQEIAFETEIDYGSQITATRTALQQALADATAAINGMRGGYVKINDTDDDGNPDEILIMEHEDGTGKIIRINAAGIGYSTNGGATYSTAITGAGIAAEAITSGKISADRINAAQLIIAASQVTGLNEAISGEIGTQISDLAASLDIELPSSVYYGTCSTTAGTNPKRVDIQGTGDFVLKPGTRIAVNFTNGSNGTSDLNLQLRVYKGSTMIGTYYTLFNDNGSLNYFRESAYKWRPHQILEFVYDGMAFELVENSIIAEQCEKIIGQWCYENDVTIIDGGKIATGTITAAKIAAGAITTDKLSVGHAVTPNILYNPEFNVLGGAYKDYTGWTVGSSSLLVTPSAVLLTPTTLSDRATLKQKVFLENGGTYQLAFSVAFPNLTAVSSAQIHMIMAGTYTDLSVSSVNQNRTVVSRVIKYTGETGWTEIGIGVKGFKTSGSPASCYIYWASLHKTSPGAIETTVCSNSAWMTGAGYIDNYSNSASLRHMESLTVDAGGNLTTLGTISSSSGQIGGMRYSERTQIIDGHSYFELTPGQFMYYDSYGEFIKPRAKVDEDTLVNDEYDDVSVAENYETTLKFGCDDPNGGSQVIENAEGVAMKTHMANGKYYSYHTARKVYLENPDGDYSELTPTSLKVNSVSVTSQEEKKKNIEAKRSCLDVLKSAKIYEYNLENDADGQKKRTGFVIPAKAKKLLAAKGKTDTDTPDEVLSEDGTGIDLYSMCSILWKATQEIAAENEALRAELDNLKDKK